MSRRPPLGTPWLPVFLLASTLLLPARRTCAEESWKVEFLSQSLFSSALRTCVEGTKLYAGCGSTLLIYDISDSLAPVRLGHFRTEGDIYGLQVHAGRAYLAALSEGVRIVDCSTPAGPVELGFIPNEPGGTAMSVFVRADTAYVADGAAGLLIVDCKLPATPQRVTCFNPYPSGSGIVLMDVAVLGRIAYGAFMNPILWSGLTAIDLREPERPGVAGQVPTWYLGSYNLCVAPDSMVYVANIRGTLGENHQLMVFDCRDPHDPVLRGWYTSPNPAATGYDVQVVGNLLYLVTGYSSDGHRGGGDKRYPNVQIFDRREVAYGMTPLGEIRTDNLSMGIAVKSGVAYVADEWAGVQVIDGSDPDSPHLVTRLDTGGYPYDAALLGNRAFVAAEGGKLRIVDFSVPHAPVELQPQPVVGVAEAVVAEGQRVFVAEGFDFVQGMPGLTVLDVSGAAPVELGRFQVAAGDTTYFLDLEVEEDLVYVANGIGGLRILDVDSLPVISEVSRRAVSGKCTGIALADTLAYLAAGEAGLRIWSVANPLEPSELGSWTEAESVFAVAVVRDTAYVACGKEGLALVDCRFTDSPRLIRLVDTEGAVDVAVRGPRAYVADWTGGLRIVDVSRPLAAHEVGFFDTAAWATGVAVRGDTVFVTDVKGGLYILRDTSADSLTASPPLVLDPGLRFLGSFPNPFRSSTAIRFVVPESEAGRAVTLQVFDVSGRLLRSLGVAANPGLQEWIWDGRDAAGRRTAAGVYFLRLSGTATAASRAIRLE